MLFILAEHQGFAMALIKAPHVERRRRKEEKRMRFTPKSSSLLFLFGDYYTGTALHLLALYQRYAPLISISDQVGPSELNFQHKGFEG